MEKKLLSIVLLTAFSGAVSAGMANDSTGATSVIGPKATTNSFENLDVDKDNFVSREEVANVVNPSVEFSQADADKDNKLNLTEYKVYINETHTTAASGPGMPGAVPFLSLDANKDGMLSQTEYESSQRVHGSSVTQGESGEAVQGSTESGTNELLVVPVPPGADALLIQPSADTN